MLPFQLRFLGDSRRLRRLPWLIALLTGVAPAVAGPGPNSKIDFNRDIRPIFADNCYNCHGPDKAKRKAGLRLDQREGATVKLESGDFAITPGDPTKSRLIERVTSADDDERMPPAKTGKRLRPDQIELLTRWIREGAEWKPHWAYITPERPAVPQTRSPRSAVRNPIDSFVLSRLEAEGLAGSLEADRRTLARRVTFDLTGLPPTIDEVDTFLADRTDAAYEKLVDRLLASQSYGERMAIPWLDLARFADSDGYHADIPRSMWQYRDYVVRAFNRNLPFDQFIVEQLAGDQLSDATLEQRIATAFNRNGMSSTEGGADPDEYMNKYVTDRVNTFGTVFLGSSIQCAECHNHKYDPFTQREYYQLYDFFNRLPEKGLDSDPAPPFVKVPTPEQAIEIGQVREEIKPIAAQHQARVDGQDSALDEAQAAWEQSLLTTAKKLEGFTLNPWKSVGPFPAANASEAFKTDSGPETKIDLAQTFNDGKLAWKDQPDWKDGQINKLTGDNSAFYLFRTITAEAPKSLTLYLGSDDGIRGWLNGKEILAKDISRGAAPNQEEVAVGLQAGENRLLLKISNGAGDFAFYFSTDKDAGDERLKKLRDLAKIAVPERKPEQATELRRYFRETQVQEIRELTGKLAALRAREAELDKRIPSIRVMEDMPEGRPSYIRVRGDYRSKGDLMTAGVPTSCLPQLGTTEKTNRLALAKWVIDPQNPLTARVTVNRFWAQFFGSGLVKTMNEFGTNGELPSHPELLDWLARDFSDHGWDTKRFLKQIVMSATYRQSSRVTPELVAKDPQNRLLARGPRFRLPAEMVRDNALAISGLLMDRIGGPSVRPYQPPGLWEEKMFAGNKYDLGKGDELYRRSLYTLWKRTVLNPTLQTFDAPDRALCTAMRPTTCTPLQAFVTLNDVTYVEAARVFAQRILGEGGTDTASRLDYAMKRAVARPATTREQRILGAVLDDVKAAYTQDAKAADALVKLGTAGRPESADPVELAAWTGVANMILNLDETVTKE